MGLFYAVEQPPLVPDAFLSVGVVTPDDWSKKENRSYFFWQFGKPPDVAIEIVSNRQGNELGSKLTDYARIAITYYAVFDPLHQLEAEMNGQLLQVFALTQGRYIQLESHWLESVNLGLTLWQGEFEDAQATWLRWYDQNGLVLTGAEHADQAETRANQAETRANQAETRAQILAERLRELGVDPDRL